MLSLLSPSFVMAEEKPIDVFIDGERINFTTDPIVKNGTTLVEFKPIFNKLGYNVSWDSTTKTVTGQNSEITINLQLNSKTAVVNDQNHTLQVAPEAIKGRTFIPLRFVSELSGKSVHWDSDTRIISIGKIVTENDMYDFRKTNWGMSKDQVKKSEKTNPLFQEENGFAYADINVAGMNSDVYYYFNNDSLYQAIYGITDDKYMNKTKYIDDYERIKQTLTDKYGKQVEDIVHWYDDLWRDDPNDWGMAIVTGDLVYVSKWINGDTEIYLTLKGDNFELAFLIMYGDTNALENIEPDDSGL